MTPPCPNSNTSPRGAHFSKKCGRNLLKISRTRPHRQALWPLACAAALTACSPNAPSADRLELTTIDPRYVIPKSTPRQLVRNFDRFCANGPATMAARESALRDTGYVPTRTPARKAERVFVIDNKRPAIGISDTMCIARATSVTGQTNAVNRYVADTFPNARPIDPSSLTVDVEQAWSVDGGILATARNRWRGNLSSYSVILFRPKAGTT